MKPKVTRVGTRQIVEVRLINEIIIQTTALGAGTGQILFDCWLFFAVAGVAHRVLVVRSRVPIQRKATMKDDNCYVVRVTVAMAPKVSGGLAAIEEEIREEEPSLTVTSLAFDPAVIDGWPIPCRIDNRWYVVAGS